MSVIFDKAREMNTDGRIYPSYGMFSDMPYSKIQILNAPLTPKENLLRFYRGSGYEWIPDTYSDLEEITPAIDPDMIASGFSGGTDSFGVVWEALENGLPALVRPGNPLLKDISDWRSITANVSDPDSWDWAHAADEIRSLGRERMLRGFVPCGLFERMIDVLDFEGAAISLLTDPDEVNAFLTFVTDYNLKIMRHYFDDLQVDAIILSDDWSSQRAPFFSVETARECLFPHLKRMVDFSHSHGAPFTLHSCGNGVDFIPLWLEAGVEGWQFQENAIDVNAAINAAQGRLKMEGYWIVPKGLNRQETYAFIDRTMRHYCMNGQMLAAFCDEEYLVSDPVRRTAYEVGRILVNELDDRDRKNCPED